MKRQLSLVKIKTMGDALAYCRMQRGISQERLFERSGVPQSTISRFERDFDVRVSTVLKLCKAMGVPLSELAAMARV